MNKNFEEEYRLLGLHIAYYRKRAGMTQLQLAELVNISRTHISTIEGFHSKTSISLDTLFRIADALDVPVEKLFHFDYRD